MDLEFYINPHIILNVIRLTESVRQLFDAQYWIMQIMQNEVVFLFETKISVQNPMSVLASEIMNATERNCSTCKMWNDVLPQKLVVHSFAVSNAWQNENNNPIYRKLKYRNIGRNIQ